MEMKNEKDWNKVPLVVLIGVVAALIPIIIFITGKQSLPEIMATPSSIASPETFKLAGIWEGTDSRGMVFRFTFASKCEVGDVCGKVELPTIGCTAIPVLVNTDGVTYEFDQTSHQNCAPDTANDTIKILGDGTLLYGSNGQPPTIILYKK